MKKIMKKIKTLAVLVLAVALAVSVGRLSGRGEEYAYAATGPVNIATAFERQFRDDIIAWATDNSYSATTLTAAQINGVKEVNVNAPANSSTTIRLSKTVDSLKGIELFTNLETLECSGTNITGKLDVSALTELTNLSCEHTGVTGLNLTGLTGLKALYCSDTDITELILDGFTSLETLVCTGLPLHSLNLSSLTSLAADKVYVGGGRYYPVPDKTVNLNDLKGFDLSRVVTDSSGKPDVTW